MSIFIGHQSALEYWRVHDRDPFSPKSQAKPRTGAPIFRELNAGLIESYGIKNLPLHFEVAGKESWRKGKHIHAHIWTGPDRSFMRIGPELYVSTPEACFLQMAKELELTELIELGYELCGTYSRDPHHAEQPLLKRNSRTNPAQIRTYLDRCNHIAGVKRAKRAARYVSSSAASPMEAKLVMLLCLPAKLGGYGLPFPEINVPVHSVLPQDKNASIHPNYRCDLLWKGPRLALEYDSDAWHASSEKLNRDSLRRGRLEALDIHVISVTKRQVYDPIEFDKLAKTVAASLEKRLRFRTENWYGRQCELRQQVLGPGVDNQAMKPKIPR